MQVAILHPHQVPDLGSSDIHLVFVIVIECCVLGVACLGSGTDCRERGNGAKETKLSVQGSTRTGRRVDDLCTAVLCPP